MCERRATITTQSHSSKGGHCNFTKVTLTPAAALENPPPVVIVAFTYYGSSLLTHILLETPRTHIYGCFALLSVQKIHSESYKT